MGWGSKIAALVLAALALAGWAATACADQLPVASLSPAAGATVDVPGTNRFVLNTPLRGLTNVSATFSISPSLGGEGTLDGPVLEHLQLREEPEGSGTFAGEAVFATSGPTWWSTPGTYYWQISGLFMRERETCSPSCFEFHEELTPVMQLSIVPLPSTITGPVETAPGSTRPPAAPVLTIGAARGTIAAIIAKRTGRRAHHLRYRCRMHGAASATCAVLWASAWPLRAGDRSYSGTFVLDAGPSSVTFSFAGRSTLVGCKRRSGRGRCASKLSWKS